MREPPRRRRMDDEPPRGGLPLFPLIVVVILAGLLLGGVLAHFFGGNTPRSEASRVAVAPTPLSVNSAPVPSETPTEGATPAQRASPTSRPSPTPRSSPSPSPRASPSGTPVVAAVASAAAVSKPETAKPETARPLAATPHPATTASVTPQPVTPAPAAGSDGGAAWVVRSYVQAVARGDRAAAGNFLMHGSATEPFLSADSQIESIHSTALGDSRYNVTADVRTDSGEFRGTFTLEQGASGLQISDRSWNLTKP